MDKEPLRNAKEDLSGSFSCEEKALKIFDLIWSCWVLKDRSKMHWLSTTKEIIRNGYPVLFFDIPWAFCEYIAIVANEGKGRAFASIPEDPNYAARITVNPKLLSGKTREEATRELVPTLMHELTHIWHSVQMYMNDKSWSQMRKNSGYDVAYERYVGQNYVDGDEEDELENQLVNCLYIFSGIERGPIIASLYGHLTQSGEKFKSVDEIIRFLRKQPRFRQFYSYGSVAYKLRQIANEETQQKMMEMVNTMTNHHFTTYHQVCKYMKNLVDKSREKAEDMIVKMAMMYWRRINFWQNHLNGPQTQRRGKYTARKWMSV